MSDLNENEVFFIQRTKEITKRKNFILVVLVITGLVFTSIGLLSVFTRFQIFNYKMFASLFAFLWIVVITNSIVFVFIISKFLVIIQKLRDGA